MTPYGRQEAFHFTDPRLFIQQFIPANSNGETNAPNYRSYVRDPSNTNELPLHKTSTVESVIWCHLEICWPSFVSSFFVARWLISETTMHGSLSLYASLNWVTFGLSNGLGPVWWWGPAAITLINAVGDYYNILGRRYMCVNVSHFTDNSTVCSTACLGL